MSTEHSRSIVGRFIEQVLNQGDLRAADELLGHAFVNYGPGIDAPATRDSYKRILGASRQVAPDFHVAVDEMLAEGDRVAVHWTLSGTHSGTMTTELGII